MASLSFLGLMLAIEWTRGDEPFFLLFNIYYIKINQKIYSSHHYEIPKMS